MKNVISKIALLILPYTQIHFCSLKQKFLMQNEYSGNTICNTFSVVTSAISDYVKTCCSIHVTSPSTAKVIGTFDQRSLWATFVTDVKSLNGAI
jgi:predicted DNA-binding protein YlxM (UPF0122 family)